MARKQNVEHPNVGLSIVVGIDPSLANVGLFAMRVRVAENGRYRIHGYEAATISTTPNFPLLSRLLAVHTGTVEFVSRALSQWPHGHSRLYVATEGYSFNDRFNQRDIAAGKAAAFIGVAHAASNARHTMPDIAEIPPRTAKVCVCPAWHGLSKENFTASGKPGAFKRSNPSKIAVQNGLFDIFKIALDSEHEADAASVAVAYMAGKYRLA